MSNDVPPADLHVHPRMQEALAQLREQFTLGPELLNRIVEQFLWEFSQGLSKVATVQDQDTFLPMIPTFLSDVPNGTETGPFLALDLGGTNLRVCAIDLKGDTTFSIRNEKYRVTDELKTGEAAVLFDYIADCVGEFVKKEFPNHNATGGPLFLGFTFSFPVHQTAIDRGTLLTWTKGFAAKNAKGNDVVKMLQDALDRKRIGVRCSCLVNDTVGTMLARAYGEGAARAGIIFGTGTNAAYLEKAANIKTLKTSGKKIDYMIVNTEWGAFDNERVVLPITPYDSKLDRESINPRKQALEKMISGMYLGEVLRNVLCHWVDQGVLFDGYSSEQLNMHYGVDTALMSQVELLKMTADEPCSADEVAQIRSILVDQVKVPAQHVSAEDTYFVHQASELVGNRAAHLSGAALAALVKQSQYTAAEKETFAVGVDGSLVENYPGFEQRARYALRTILGPEIEAKVEISLAKDGSGVGAALGALQAKKQAEIGVQTTHAKTTPP